MILERGKGAPMWFRYEGKEPTRYVGAPSPRNICGQPPPGGPWVRPQGSHDGCGERISPRTIDSRGRRGYGCSTAGGGGSPTQRVGGAGSVLVRLRATASASSLFATPAGTPWLTTLKNPNHSHASTTARAAPGPERSTAGRPGSGELPPGSGDLTSEIWSSAGGFARTTMLDLCCRQETEHFEAGERGAGFRSPSPYPPQAGQKFMRPGHIFV